MKYFIINFCFIISSLAFAEINDQSFKDTDKYSILKLAKVGAVDSVNLKIKFFPPENKKVNQASYIKVWEKEKDVWTISSTFVVRNLPRFEYINLFENEVALHSKKTELAVEVEFIYCGYTGGQCSMEKYLGKINRSSKSNNKTIAADLRIK